MPHKEDMPYGFSDFLQDDEFIAKISDLENPTEYINYIIDLKKIYPDQAENIDLAVELFFVMKNTRADSNKFQKQKVWDKIVRDRAVKKRRYLLGIAASVILLLGIGGAFFYVYNSNQAQSIEKFAKLNETNFSKSRLILSDGKNIAIPDYESKVAYSSNGENVIINDSTKVIQEVKAENFNQMIVPFGKYNSLLLSDGTKVWINSGSRLVYPPVFSGESREVYLEGEAYFEVTKNTAKPFFVKTDRFRVEVKGTKFNVQADGKKDLFSALLIEGEVTLSSITNSSAASASTKLDPGHLATLNEDGNNFSIVVVDHPENYIAWKNGYLMFNDEPLRELLIRISRYYNISIDLKNQSSTQKITGKLDLKDDPERVLRGIAAISKCKLINEGGNYILN